MVKMGEGFSYLIYSAPLAETAAALRSEQIDLFTYLDDVCRRLDELDPFVHAFLPEADRPARLRTEATALQARFPDPDTRPPLYGIPVGVKDVFPVNGFPTQAGSQLPPEVFVAPEATCVTMLRAAGALILGKTVTTEFAYFEPGPTRNPHHLDHTPGGSSSGSAAAVAAGMCPLALGTQTIGSTIRPAAFCGIVGFKPTFGRLPRAGLILCSDSLDHVGYFTQDVAGTALVASLLCHAWHPVTPAAFPVLAVPDGPYLLQASTEALEAFERQLALLQNAGYTVRRVATLGDSEAIHHRQLRLVFAEMAQVHAAWFDQYASLYRPRTAAAIREGRTVSVEEAVQAREGRTLLRTTLESLMAQEGIDVWICPAAPGPAPEGIDATGNPIMNLPWTYAGMPAITVPAGRAANGLPLGFQCVAATLADEYLLAWAGPIAEMMASL
jgi:Asp-tRNA(Asn)/Glu-tRNA(Gln) amidotransferase A subunit family amidase